MRKVTAKGAKGTPPKKPAARATTAAKAPAKVATKPATKKPTTRAPKALYEVVIEGTRSLNRIHFKSWPHPLPRKGEKMYAKAAVTRIHGTVTEVVWAVDGTTNARGDVKIVVSVLDNPNDNNSAALAKLRGEK